MCNFLFLLQYNSAFLKYKTNFLLHFLHQTALLRITFQTKTSKKVLHQGSSFLFSPLDIKYDLIRLVFIHEKPREAEDSTLALNVHLR